MLQLTPQLVRRLAITKQRLAGNRPPATRDGLRALLTDLRCVQIDPIRAVERTQYLVPFSRLGPYDPNLLDSLAYEERFIFEYWAHAASYVLTEDYPIHSHMMRNFDFGDGVWARQLKKWLEENGEFPEQIIDRIRREGPMQVSEIEDHKPGAWHGKSDAVWASGRNTPMVVSSLWFQGELAVAKRKGLQKTWDLAERVLPEWTPRDLLTPYEVTRRSLEHALRALGAAPLRHLRSHFTRNRYPELAQAVEDLVAERRILPVEIDGGREAWHKAGGWYIHSDDLAALDLVTVDDWQPHTALLSPFDNLICDRGRTELLWDFFYRIEIYVPPKKREYGYYVMPILHGERLVGRIDPRMDRKSRTLRIQAVYREDGAPDDRETVDALRTAITALAEFLGAQQLDISPDLPAGWEKLTP